MDPKVSVLSTTPQRPTLILINLYSLLFTGWRCIKHFCLIFFKLWQDEEFLYHQPHFKSLLLQKIKFEPREFVLLFHESMNSKTQNEQMSFHVRIWEGRRNKNTLLSLGVHGACNSWWLGHRFWNCYVRSGFEWLATVVNGWTKCELEILRYMVQLRLQKKNNNKSMLGCRGLVPKHIASVLVGFGTRPLWMNQLWRKGTHMLQRLLDKYVGKRKTKSCVSSAIGET